MVRKLTTKKCGGCENNKWRMSLITSAKKCWGDLAVSKFVSATPQHCFANVVEVYGDTLRSPGKLVQINPITNIFMWTNSNNWILLSSNFPYETFLPQEMLSFRMYFCLQVICNYNLRIKITHVSKASLYTKNHLAYY